MEKGKTDELFEPFNWTSNTEQTGKKAVELTREQTQARTNERKLVWTNESSYERTKARTNERKLVRTNESSYERTKARMNERKLVRMNESSYERRKLVRTNEYINEWTNEQTSRERNKL